MDPTSIGCWSPDTLVDMLTVKEPDFRSDARNALCRAATKFHTDLSVSNEHTDSLIAQLQDPDSWIIRFAHQPNFFPYLQVFAQIAFLSAARRAGALKGNAVVPIYYAIDCDTASNRWTYSAKLIDKSCKGQIRKIMVPSDELVPNVPLFCHPDLKHSTKEVIFETIKDTTSTTGPRSDWVRSLVSPNQAQASLGDFNLSFLSRICIDAWHLPLLIVRQSDCIVSLQSPMRSLAEQLMETFTAPLGTYFWRFCSSCGRRTKAEAASCDHSSTDSLILPKVTADEILDRSFFGFDGGTAYASGLDHIRKSHATALALNVRPMLESVWKLDAIELPSLPLNARQTSNEALALISSGRYSLASLFGMPAEFDGLPLKLQDAMNRVGKS